MSQYMKFIHICPLCNEKLANEEYYRDPCYAVDCYSADCYNCGSHFEGVFNNDAITVTKDRWLKTYHRWRKHCKEFIPKGLWMKHYLTDVYILKTANNSES